MTLKKIPRRFIDLLHLSLYILILLLFADYEATRKAQAVQVSAPTAPLLFYSEKQ